MEEKGRMLIVWGNDEKKRLTVWEEKRREGCCVCGTMTSLDDA